MDKNKIKKLKVQTTIKALSLLGALTIVGSTMAGCAEKNENKNNTTTTYSTSDTTTATTKATTTVTTTKTTEIKTTKAPTKVTKTTKRTSNNNNNDDDYVDYEFPTQANIAYPGKISKSNINKVDTIRYYGQDLLETISGTTISSYWDETASKSYLLNPSSPELKLFVVMLNKDYISKDTINNLFKSYSNSEIKRFTHSFDNILHYFVYSNNNEIDLCKFIVDSNKKELLMKLREAATTGEETKDISKIRTIWDGFYTDKTDNININNTDGMYTYIIGKYLTYGCTIDDSVRLRLLIEQTCCNGFKNLENEAYEIITTKSKVL